MIARCDPRHDDSDAQFEVRAFISGDGMPEDPATGGLNAGIAQWLLGPDWRRRATASARG